jgi:4-cresol dehydrogenase (hydroxylating) flavoprotein subunit
MDRILRLDDEFGCATIEPGVTQAQLSNALAASKSRYFLDVTGSARETSVLGNALDRGIAYNSLRAETLVGVEAVLGSGRVIRTGFGHYPQGERVGSLFRWGLGPALDGLFVQSNFGIVLSGIIELIPMKSEAQLEDLTEALRSLKRTGELRSIVHVGNRRRSELSLAPLIHQYFRERGVKLTREQAESRLNLQGAWTAVGNLMGTEDQVRLARRSLERTLGPFGPLRIVTKRSLRVARWLSALRPNLDRSARIAVLEMFFGLNHGVPSDGPLRSVHWPVSEEDPNHLDPDRGRAGILFSTPIIPMNREGVRDALEIVRGVEARFGRKIAVTLNFCRDRFIEGVVSVDFDREDPGQTEQARSALDALTDGFISRGLYPYRIDIDHVDRLVSGDDPFWKLAAELKSVMDPNGIIAPGKLNLI